MKLAWLEDFLALLDCGTFSAAAQRRNVTQPAFSRRIRMLEDWLGVALVDRSAHRFTPTATARRFEREMRTLVGRTHELRTRMRADTLDERRLTVTTPHTLMVTHLPVWLHRFQGWQPETAFLVRTGNSEECVRQLERGDADLMIGYEAESVAAVSEGAMATLERAPLSVEYLLPVVAQGEGSAAIGADRMPLLAYPAESFLGRVVRRHCLPALTGQLEPEIVCESAFAAGLKAMCLAGLGVAWLPSSLVAQELARGALDSLAPRLPAPALEVSALRLPEHVNPALPELWRRLARRHGNPPPGQPG
ncbi:LysR family transcriptional regulator [Sediminicurvatus halobius]|nr:LysR substrate-binding domain-containing protein [Spiribacter halobius]UEX79452.1 LysR family transcriptional regulator [Spiribacter halobius]